MNCGISLRKERGNLSDLCQFYIIIFPDTTYPRPKSESSDARVTRDTNLEAGRSCFICSVSASV